MPEDSRQESDVIRYNKAHYGVLISEARRRAGLTQLDFARALGISKNIVTHWEAGRVKPDLNLIPRLCGVLGLTLEDFFQQPSAGDRLTRREQALLEAYRSLPGRVVGGSCCLNPDPEARVHGGDEALGLAGIGQP